eukprot:6933075-Heterocapsa_arctica.AAC.1
MILGAEEWAEVGGAEIEIEHTSLGNHLHGHDGREECNARGNPFQNSNYEEARQVWESVK